MTNWRKYILVVAAVTTAAGFGYIKSSHRHIPADLRDAVADKAVNQLGVDRTEAAIPEPQPVAVESVGANVGIKGLEGYKMMLIEKERAEHSLRTSLDVNGPQSTAHYKAKDIYIDLKSKIYAWNGTAKIRLAGNASISSKEECRYLAAIIRGNDSLSSYAASLAPFHIKESLFKPNTDKALCGSLFKTGTLQKFLMETQRAFNDADNTGKDVIYMEMDALVWDGLFASTKQ